MTICAIRLSSPLNSTLSWDAGGAGGFGVRSVLPPIWLQIINLLKERIHSGLECFIWYVEYPFY